MDSQPTGAKPRERRVVRRVVVMGAELLARVERERSGRLKWCRLCIAGCRCELAGGWVNEGPFSADRQGQGLGASHAPQRSLAHPVTSQPRTCLAGQARSQLSRAHYFEKTSHTPVLSSGQAAFDAAQGAFHTSGSQRKRQRHGGCNLEHVPAAVHHRQRARFINHTPSRRPRGSRPLVAVPGRRSRHCCTFKALLNRPSR